MTLFTRYISPFDMVSSFYDAVYSTRSSLYPSVVASQRRAKFLPIDDATTHLEVELPGYERNQIEVYSEKNSLVISAKNDSGSSKRSYECAFPIHESEKVEKVKYVNGILTVVLNKVVKEELKRKNYTIE